MTQATFSLLAVLTTNQRQRDRCQQSLASKVACFEQIDAQRLLLISEMDKITQAMRSCLAPGRTDLDRLADCRRCRQMLKSSLHSCEEQQAGLAVEIQDARSQMVEADRQVRLLEKLRTRQADAQRQQATRRQWLELAELPQVGLAPGGDFMDK